jgi:uncharacterized protein (DUF924 family)
MGGVGPEMHRQVLEFWFEEIEPTAWWRKDDALDRQIAQRFSSLHRLACRCELFRWRRTPAGRLAEIIVLDQFSRNLYRGRPEAFANDALALGLAQEALSIGADAQLDATRRGFLYMPFMHSESLAMHAIAIELFGAPGLEAQLEFERAHKAIIERFGRYPHRNEVLGRASTREEIEFLSQPGSSF